MASKQIFLIGAPRSGTTFLGEVLSKHSKIAYWPEPKYIWKYRRPLAKDDARPAGDATDGIKKYISKKFIQFAEKNNKIIFLEKTPSNCFRIPFINEIFPESKFIHVIRDGMESTFSAYRLWHSKANSGALMRRLSSMEIPAVDLPF